MASNFFSMRRIFATRSPCICSVSYVYKEPSLFRSRCLSLSFNMNQRALSGNSPSLGRVGHFHGAWHCNQSSDDPIVGERPSIEVILSWSVRRISFVVVAPVDFSLGIGLRLNSRDWKDATTIQTTWSVALYIATAVACELSRPCSHRQTPAAQS